MFATPDLAQRFHLHFANRTVIPGRNIAFAKLNYFHFDVLFARMGWLPIVSVNEFVYPKIVFDVAALCRILEIPNEGVCLYEAKKWPRVEGFKPAEALQRLCGYPRADRPTSHLLTVLSRILHHMISYIFIPKGGHRDDVSFLEAFWLTTFSQKERREKLKSFDTYDRASLRRMHFVRRKMVHGQGSLPFPPQRLMSLQTMGPPTMKNMKIRMYREELMQKQMSHKIPSTGGVRARALTNHPSVIGPDDSEASDNLNAQIKSLFQPFEAMHQPVLVCFATGCMWPFGFWGKQLAVSTRSREHPQPVANCFATGCHWPLWDVHEEMACGNRLSKKVYRLQITGRPVLPYYKFSILFSFLLAIDGRGKLGHLNGELNVFKNRVKCCSTIAWTTSVHKGVHPDVQYTYTTSTTTGRVFTLFSTLGDVAFVYAGHNMVWRSKQQFLPPLRSLPRDPCGKRLRLITCTPYVALTMFIGMLIPFFSSLLDSWEDWFLPQQHTFSLVSCGLVFTNLEGLAYHDLHSSGNNIDDFSSHWCTKTDHPSSQDLQIVLVMIFPIAVRTWWNSYENSISKGNWQCQLVEEHPNPVANWFATGCHWPFWDVHQEMASVNRSSAQVYRLHITGRPVHHYYKLFPTLSFLLPIDDRGKLGHLNGEVSKPVALQNESHFHQIFVYANKHHKMPDHILNLQEKER
ncbi:Lysine histidine transporter 2 [Vitis vinifera]|uniref:Lysine histidine transporter 2 n=1 Tax=Vitis vinifera TaxID=29760 RepID=A0A438K6J2_VITVI|nr:Lysine histidine transporter 2 [Vitis vinifera]